MDCYEIWVDLAPGVDDMEFIAAVRAYLDAFREESRLECYRIRRRKFGFGPEALGEFCLTLEFSDLSQLDSAFHQAATRSGVIEDLHRQVYSRVKNFKSALYRDYPDPERS